MLSAPVVTIESQLPTTPVATDGSLTAVAIGVEPLQYNWSLPGAPNQPQLNQITAGQYSVSVTDANGCQTIAHATLLSQYPAMTAAIWVGNMPASGVFCTNEPIFVKGQYNNTPHKINWLLPNAQPASATTDTVTLQFAQPGNYTITLIAADLYTTDTATLTIKVAAAPEIVFQTRAAHLNQFDGQIMALVSEGMPPYGYKWSTGLEDANTITGLNFGNYSLTVTDGSGCPVVRSITLGVAIDNPLQMQVYSHTGNRLLQIYNANPENVPANLQLYAVTGQLVWQGNISANTAFSLNMAAFLPQGLYFAVLQANGYIVVEKIFCGE
ncbi:MAG: T9SS type A sorting domain-containing protein [Sphingobacteriales bacterium]|nr:T9SS type A sorting domain-containing protein [Sphingobacteriales bacterium]